MHKTKLANGLTGFILSPIARRSGGYTSLNITIPKEVADAYQISLESNLLLTMHEGYFTVSKVEL